MPLSNVLDPSFIPVPSALVSFRSFSGEPQALFVGWVGVICTSPAVLTVSFRCPEADFAAVREGEPFALNIPDEEMLQALAKPVRPDMEGSPRGRLSFIQGAWTGTPLISECPVQIECRCLHVEFCFEQKRLSGEIIAVHIDGVRHDMAAPVDLFRLNPFKRCYFPGSRRIRHATAHLDSDKLFGGELE